MSYIVLTYSPDEDHWSMLPPLVDSNAVVALNGQLLMVGGINKRTGETVNTILTFDESSQQWLQSLPLMPVAVSFPAVVEYQDHLIIASGQDSNLKNMTDVNILDTTTNKWTSAEPLPQADYYNPCLIGDTLYLVSRNTKQVLRADLPSLISRASSGVWETVASIPWYWSSLVNVGNTLLTLGGCDSQSLSGNKTIDIHLYDPTKDQWTKCGDLPEPMICYCIKLSDKLYAFQRSLDPMTSSSVYISTLSISH